MVSQELKNSIVLIFLGFYFASYFVDLEIKEVNIPEILMVEFPTSHKPRMNSLGEPTDIKSSNSDKNVN